MWATEEPNPTKLAALEESNPSAAMSLVMDQRGGRGVVFPKDTS